jgi:hypothetical protein
MKPCGVAKIRLERKVIYGYFSASKKSGLLRCRSRSDPFVLIEFTPMTTLTDDRAASPSAYMMLPRTPPNAPRTFDIPMNEMVNPTSLCTASIWYRCGKAGALAAAAACV